MLVFLNALQVDIKHHNKMSVTIHVAVINQHATTTNNGAHTHKQKNNNSKKKKKRNEEKSKKQGVQLS